MYVCVIYKTDRDRQRRTETDRTPDFSNPPLCLREQGLIITITFSYSYS